MSNEKNPLNQNGTIFSKEMFKNRVWISSLESADKLQFSILALVETLVAVGVSFFIWIYYGFYWHIVTGLIVSPLFFLRTNESIKANLLLFHKLIDKIRFIEKSIKIIHKTKIIWNSPNIIFSPLANILSNQLHNSGFIGKVIFIILILSLAILYILFYLLLGITIFSLVISYGILIIILLLSLLLLSSIISKIIITIKMTYKYPMKSIKSIPSNWFKTILSTDIFYPLELVPDIEKTDSDYKLSSFFSSVSSYNKIFMIFMILIIFVPTLIYRYSIKSTAWIYLPLIWLIEPQNKEDLNTRLKIESKNFIAYLMFFYSIIIVFIFTLLPLIFPHTAWGVYLQTLAIPPTLKTIFFAYEFNLWHLTRFLSALITIMFMFSFTKILIRRETNPNYGDTWGARLLSLRDFRSVLTLITLGFTAYHILGLLPDGFFSDLWRDMKFLPE